MAAAAGFQNCCPSSRRMAATPCGSFRSGAVGAAGKWGFIRPFETYYEARLVGPVGFEPTTNGL